MIKAVIYDMDGVLIDSEPLWHQAEIQSFATVGVKLTEQMCLQTTGLRVDEVVNYWDEKYPWNGDRAQEIESLIWENIIQLVKDSGEPKKGVKESLELVKDAGYTIGLASTSAMVLIDTVLDKLAIRGYFSAVHSAEFEEYGKPHPGVYLTTAKQLQIPPQQCVAIEDSINGMIAAKAARMKCIAIPDREQKSNKRLGIADYILDSLLEVDSQLLTAL